MMRDEKAIRYALLLKQYCSERPFKDGKCECAFRQKLSGICPLAEGRLPEDWQLDELKREDKNDRRRNQGTCKRV